MNICKVFDKSFERMKQENWEKIYVLVDIHDTIFRACYYNEETYDWFPYAKETLQLMSKMKDISIILWTSSYSNKILLYDNFFEANNIYIDMCNCNVEVENTKLSDFSEKPYFNVGIDDKFGFEAETDWKILYDYLKNRNDGTEK